MFVFGKEDKQPDDLGKTSRRRLNKPPIMEKQEAIKGNMTYVSAVTGSSHTIPKSRERNPTVIGKHLLSAPDSSCNVLGKVRCSLCRWIMLWVWIEFNSSMDCENFMSNDTLKDLFSILKPVSEDFVLDEQLIWVEINDVDRDSQFSDQLDKLESTPVDHQNNEFSKCVEDLKSMSTKEKSNGNNDPFLSDKIIEETGIERNKTAKSVNNETRPSNQNQDRPTSDSSLSRPPEKFNKFIDLGKALGYDMGGSKDDLGKLLNGIGIFNNSQ
ncbi:hypothetical protein L1987_54241 [Smallanthus sonchifolius]|uniref:Uncharacterized protein n=1 Tax=Smallanthus sonchifolius TaxID=185202 RepID=A0ACB9E6L0_9ASTR|nr:hypothetical protein L1987_54241 [Smallanthus sonchifolius]